MQRAKTGWMKALFGFGALLAVLGCRESEIVRGLGTSVNPEGVGLRVEWTQRPVLRVNETELDFDYGGRVQAEKGLYWSVLRVQNISEQPVSFLLGEEMSSGLRVRSRYLVTRINQLEENHPKGFVGGNWLRAYESEWKSSDPKILRENGRLDAATPYHFSQEGHLPESTQLAPGEAAEVVVWLRPHQASVVPSVRRTPAPIFVGSTYRGTLFMSSNPQMRSHPYHIEALCRRDFEGAVRYRLYAVGEEGVSAQGLQIGSPSNQRSLSSSFFRGGEKAACDHPSPPDVTKGLIPAAF